MAKDSPEMEQYSRLLSHLQNSFKQKKPEVYEGLAADIAVLQSNNRDIVKLIETDLKSILPSMLLFSVNKDVSVRTSVIKSFDMFNCLVNRKPSIKSESWWKEMETSIIVQDFSVHLIKLVETMTDETWPHIWAFVISLIVHDEQVHGVAINSLLKVVEIAFKLSRKQETVLEKAYYCWNKLIDIFCVHPKIVSSQKLIELLVRPLSTNLSLKCPKLKLETWNNLVHKVGFACGNIKCKLVIEPFIDFAYLKDDSLCQLYPVDCIRAFCDIVKEKKLYKFCVTKIMSALLNVFQSGTKDELNEFIIEIWTGVIDNAKELEKANQNEYITELVNKLPQILQIDRPGLNESLIQVTLEKRVFNTENMKMFILAQVPVMPIISNLMNHKEFQKNFFSSLVNDLLEHFLESQNKKSQNNVELEIWDLVCEVFILWLKSLPLPQQPSSIDSGLLCSLLLVPLLSKQWTVPVQRTWNSVMEYTQIIVPSNNYLLEFIEKFHKELRESHISAEFAVEFCTFLSNKDKSVFKSLVPTFNLISTSLPNKDPKPLMDLLVLLENSMRFIPKQELMKLLTDLMNNSNSYGQPYDLRIKTKITKLQRKLFSLKDPNEGSKEHDGQQSKSQDKEQQNGHGQKTRSPLMAQSNFLHRLAKAEEKKSKKRATMSSIFGDIHPNEEVVEALSPERSDNDNKLDVDTPLKHTPTASKEEKKETHKEEGKEAEEKKAPVINGRSSPAIPSVVTVVTTPNRKRGVKQPETTPTQEKKNAVAAKATPPPPLYFEDEAQDCVIVPPKPKSTPLTDHQKEVMSKRRSDIPALYQDLSQDTQSMNSQSLKVITLKEIKLNDSAKSSEIIAPNKDEKEEVNTSNLKIDEDSKKKEQTEGMIVENKEVSDSQDIINDSQCQYDSGVNLSLTPTKHTSAPPTQKNLLNKFNLLECDENVDAKKVEEEDEIEKENKIVNIEEVANQKSSVKRRSMRKSTNRYVTKKGDDTPKNKLKKDISESSTPNSELTPREKMKEVSDNLLKSTDDTTKTKINVLEVTKIDLEDDIKENVSNEIPTIGKKDIENSESSLVNNMEAVTVKIDSDIQKSNISNKTEVKNCQDLPKINKQNESVVVEITNKSLIEDKLEILKEKCTTEVENKSSDIQTKVVSDLPKNDTEELKTPLKTYGSKSKTIEVSETTIEISISTCNVEKNENTSILQSEKNSGLPIAEGKENLSEGVIANDVKQTSSNFISSITDGNNSETEEKLKDPAKLSAIKENNVSEDRTEDNVIIISSQSSDDISQITKSVNSSSFTEANGEVQDKKKDINSEVIEISDDQSEITSKDQIEIKIEEEEDMDQNSSADSNAASWSMVTPEKKRRKRSRVVDETADKYSPKVLRSKRLSLPKQTPEKTPSAEKSNKKGRPSLKNNSKLNKSALNDTLPDIKTPEDKKTLKKSDSTESTESIVNLSSAKNAESEIEMDYKISTPELEERKAHKRRNQDQSITPPSQPKKQKTDSNSEEASQDSLALLKNNSVKPRKKKIIKSNMKASPNNLEQWLIKTGKSVVKTSLLSSSEQLSGLPESKIINSNSEIQISSSEPKKIIVEMSPASKSNSANSLVIEDNTIVIEDDQDVTVTEETKGIPGVSETVSVIGSKAEYNSIVSCLVSDDDESIPSVLEPEVSHKIIIQTQEDDIETIERQFLEAIKRGAEEKEQEETDVTNQRQVRISHRIVRQVEEDDDDDDEDLLTESLKCEETEFDRSNIELDRVSNASRVKMDSMIYAKYKTTLRRPRRRKRLLRRVKKQDDEIGLEEELEEEEETFDEKRERLTTPFRSTGGRSAQMVKMATTEEEPPVTPVRGRRSITPLQLTENWPEGRCEQWVPCLPTPPGISPSLSILKRKGGSPVVSPVSSPNTKKKRVSFLDPPVSKGLLYSKGSDNIGQVQHANIPPGKRPIWQGFENESDVKETESSNILKDEEDGNRGPVEAEDELTAIQEFLNSTPDAPWKDTPLAGDISRIPGVLTCNDPVQNIISRIASQGNEKKLSEELQRLKINTIGGFCSLTVSEIKKLSIRPAKVSTLYNVLKDYFQCLPSSSKKLQSAKSEGDSSKSDEKMDLVETQIEITTLGIEMGVQVDPSEVCSDDMLTMSQTKPISSLDYCLTPLCEREPDMYSDSQEEIKIPTRNEIGLMFQSEVFIKRAAPFATFDFISKLAAAAADYFGPRPI